MEDAFYSVNVNIVARMISGLEGGVGEFDMMAVWSHVSCCVDRFPWAAVFCLSYEGSSCVSSSGCLSDLSAGFPIYKSVSLC